MGNNFVQLCRAPYANVVVYRLLQHLIQSIELELGRSNSAFGTAQMRCASSDGNEMIMLLEKTAKSPVTTGSQESIILMNTAHSQKPTAHLAIAWRKFHRMVSHAVCEVIAAEANKYVLNDQITRSSGHQIYIHSPNFHNHPGSSTIVIILLMEEFLHQ